MSVLNKTVILVVDDSIDNRELLQVIIESKGYTFCGAENGQAALEALESLPTLPKLILLDSQMPVMNGSEFRSKQKKSLRFRKIPVIRMSAANVADMSAEMNDVAGVLTKPYQIEDVYKVVSEDYSL
ncbi:MAG: response regulator [Bdellovibrionales bacterium]|nr:response regulator [Bdellovibrionales bacterium]